jgi:hypothetical protein
MISHSLIRISSLCRRTLAFALLAALCATIPVRAQDHPAAKPAPNPEPDVLLLGNGDTLHGKFVSEIAGKVTFHSDPLGDVSLGWDKIKELHTSQKFAVLENTANVRSKKEARQIPVGTLEVAQGMVTVHPDSTAAEAPVPVKNATYIMDAAELDKQVNHEPGFFSGWNGAATAGAMLVTATQSQYTVSGGVGLVRVVPTASWLSRRDRTSVDFNGSFGKITQPAYTSGSTTVPAVSTKSAIFHADAERDEYLSPRFFTLGQAAFDHNFGQDLNLQQVYGGGFGWTALTTPKQEADLKGTIQYEKQQFITGVSSGNQNLIGSTFAATYVLHLRLFTYTQGLAYIPAYNNVRAYSTNENNTLSFPAYKRLSFSLGTMDSYLNNPPVSLPPTKRNSFQFTMGLTYAIKSKD